MIVVKVELWPGGDKTRKRPLGRMKIWNDNSGTATAGNYKFELAHAGVYYGKRKGPFKTGRVRNFLRRLSPYRLIYRCLKEAEET